MSKHPAVKTLESFEFSFQPSIKVDLPYPCQVLGFDVLGQQRLDLLYRLRGGEFGEGRGGEFGESRHGNFRVMS